MVKYPLRVNTATFREWLSEFGNRVSKKLYKKLDYDKWRPMYLWSKPGTDWEDIEINVFDCPEMVYIVPRHTDKLSPNGVEIMLHESSFGDYLIGVMEDYNNTALNYNNASVSAISNALSIAADATYATSSYDTCTKLSAHDHHIYENLQDWQPWTIDVNTDGLRVDGGSLKEYIEKTVNKINNNAKKKENKEMLKFDFGPVDSSVHMSLYGMAIKNASGTYVAYDKVNKQIMDVDILNFEGANKFIYKMPATLAQIAAGDVIIHARKPMFVQEVREDNRLSVMDIFDGEEKVIVPSVSPFGFNFVTKVVSLFDFSNTTANEANPFGNMLPFLLMSDSKSSDKDNLLPLLFMMNGNTDMAQNPMMLWALMGNRTNDPMMLAMLMGGFGAKPNGCGGNCSCHKDK